jgi:hypothetical protein
VLKKVLDSGFLKNSRHRSFWAKCSYSPTDDIHNRACRTENWLAQTASVTKKYRNTKQPQDKNFILKTRVKMFHLQRG